MRQYDPNKECENIIKRIKDILHERGMTLGNLAKESDVAVSTLSELLNGKSRPQIYTLYKICNGLDVEIDELINSSNINNDCIDADVEIPEIMRLCYIGLPKWKQDSIKEYLKMINQYQP